MATIIRAAEARDCLRTAPFNFEDVVAEADRRIAELRTDAAHIVAQAKAEAEAVRRRAAEEGRRAAMLEIDAMVEQRAASVLKAIDCAAAEIKQTKQAWLAHWESAAVRLSAAMAAKIVRGELRDRPEITLSLVREALELAAGSPDVRLKLNPSDFRSLGGETRRIIESMPALGNAEVVADESVGPGGCLVETRFGAIDQRIEVQLDRIAEELLG